MYSRTAAATLIFSTVLSPLASEVGEPFSKATFTEVIRQVDVLDHPSLSATPAQIDEIFSSPDLLQTGRKSRAELAFNDGTLTRVGSNTIFSLESQSRTINLKQGSLLFHSPEGKGGGKIVTASATASVVGTTIIVAATSDGGFKILVLEGSATVTYLDGSILSLRPGQMTFVLPEEETGVRGPSKGKKKRASASGAGHASGSSKSAKTARRKAKTHLAKAVAAKLEKAGRKGPVLEFDLDRQASASTLVHGFRDKIEDARLHIKQEISKDPRGKPRGI